MVFKILNMYSLYFTLRITLFLISYNFLGKISSEPRIQSVQIVCHSTQLVELSRWKQNWPRDSTMNRDTGP